MTTKPQNNQTLVVRHQPQGEVLAKFWKSDAKIQVLIGPLGSAKTTDACMKIMGYINDQPRDKTPDADGLYPRRSQWMVMRNTTVDLKGTTIRDWREVFTDDLGEFNFAGPIVQELRWRHRDGQSKIVATVFFVGIDTFGDIRKLRGFQLTGAWVDEAKEILKDTVDMLFARTGRYPKPIEVEYTRRMILTSNRAPADHWTETLRPTKPRGWEFFIQPGGVIKVSGKWITNPKGENIANLQPDYYDDQIEGKREDWIRANLANEAVHVVDGRPVHPDFSERVHVAGSQLEPDQYEPIHMGFDWGRTPAGLIFQRHWIPGFDRPQWRVLREITTTNTTIPTFAKAVKRVLASEFEGHVFGENWGDPSNDRSNASDDNSCQMMEANGVSVYPSPCDNDPEIRTAALDDQLTTFIGGEPAILIDPRCTMFIKGLAGGYRYRRISTSGPEMYSDKPEKRDPTSHVVEAGHYLLVGEGEGQRVVGGEADDAWMAELDRWKPNPAMYE